MLKVIKRSLLLSLAYVVEQPATTSVIRCRDWMTFAGAIVRLRRLLSTHCVIAAGLCLDRNSELVSGSGRNSSPDGQPETGDPRSPSERSPDDGGIVYGTRVSCAAAGRT